MASVTQALDRLDEALVRLERALSARLKAEASHAEQLQAENDRLAQECQVLNEATVRTSERLEQTLARIDGLLKVTSSTGKNDSDGQADVAAPDVA